MRARPDGSPASFYLELTVFLAKAVFFWAASSTFSRIDSHMARGTIEPACSKPTRRDTLKDAMSAVTIRWLARLFVLLLAVAGPGAENTSVRLSSATNFTWQVVSPHIRSSAL